MKKTLFTIVIVICIPIVAALSQRQPGAPTSVYQPKWEYGSYRVSAGKHRYEWVDSSKYVYAEDERVFSKKLGIARMFGEMNAKYPYKSLNIPQHLTDMAFVNCFGDQGWELLELVGGASGRGLVVTFKRIKNQ
jgi:hypothetical protein